MRWDVIEGTGIAVGASVDGCASSCAVGELVGDDCVIATSNKNMEMPICCNEGLFATKKNTKCWNYYENELKPLHTKHIDVS